MNVKGELRAELELAVIAVLSGRLCGLRVDCAFSTEAVPGRVWVVRSADLGCFCEGSIELTGFGVKGHLKTGAWRGSDA